MGPTDTHYLGIEPRPGTITRLDGSSANMLDLKSYPVKAECLKCGRPITCENYLVSEWVHTPEEA